MVLNVIGMISFRYILYTRNVKSEEVGGADII